MHNGVSLGIRKVSRSDASSRGLKLVLDKSNLIDLETLTDKSGGQQGPRV